MIQNWSLDIDHSLTGTLSNWYKETCEQNRVRNVNSEGISLVQRVRYYAFLENCHIRTYYGRVKISQWIAPDVILAEDI